MSTHDASTVERTVSELVQNGYRPAPPRTDGRATGQVGRVDLDGGLVVVFFASGHATITGDDHDEVATLAGCLRADGWRPDW
jgi:hypothetical protein